MHDFLSRDLEARWRGEAAEVNRLASQVVNVLAAKGQDQPAPREPGFTRFVEAAASGDQLRLSDVVGDLRRERISTRQIVDVYIPLAARKLGADWVSDTRGFAEVTIGSALLQSLLRQIGSDWSADRGDAMSAHSVLVVVPDGEDHTLGALVATAQLRRAGISVCLRIKPTLPEVSDLVAQRPFDAILLSWANAERLDIPAVLVKKLRSAQHHPAPVFIGGAVIGRAGGIEAVTGADLATNDIDLVLERLIAIAGPALKAAVGLREGAI